MYTMSKSRYIAKNYISKRIKMNCNLEQREVRNEQMIYLLIERTIT